MTFDHLSSKDGLSQNSVLSTYQDSKGFMWFGTQAGLNRYDGVTFYEYTSSSENNSIPRGYVNCIFEDKKFDLLWVGTSTGLCTIDPSKNYDTKRIMIASKQGKKYNVTSLAQDKTGDVVILASGSLFVYDGHSAIPIEISTLANSTVRDMVSDPVTGAIIINTGSGIYQLGFKNSYFLQKIITADIKGKQWFSKLLVSRNALLLNLDSVVYAGYFVRDQDSSPTKIILKKKLAFKTLTFNKIRQLENSSVLFQDRNGDFLIGTERDGLLAYSNQFNFIKQFVRDFNRDESISSVFIQSIFESSDGVVWIGTNGGGINKIVGGRPVFKRYFTSTINIDSDFVPNNDIWAIERTDNYSLLLGTDGNGLIKLNLTGSAPPVRFWDGTLRGSNVVRVLKRFKDSILIGTNSGLYFSSIWNLKEFWKGKKLFNNSVRSVCLDHESIYVGTGNDGIFLLDTNFNRKRIFFSNDSLSNCVNFICKGDSGKFFAATSNGLYILRKHNHEYSTVAKMLDNAFVTTVLVQNGKVWVGTSGNGIWCYSADFRKLLFHFDKTNGLIDNVVYAMSTDKFSNIWLSSNKGLSELNTKDTTFNHYTRGYALQFDEFNLGAVYEDSTQLFFGGVNGLNSFQPTGLSNGRILPKVYLLLYRDNNNQGLYPDIMSFSGGKININPYLYNYRIDIRLTNYTDPQNNRYKYSLNDTAWSAEKPMSESIYLTRTSLNHWKKNILRVKLRSSSGKWTTLEPIDVNFPIDLFAELKNAGPWMAISTLVAFSMLSAIVIYLIVWVVRRLRNQVKEITEEFAQVENENMLFLNLQHLTNILSRAQEPDEIIGIALNDLTSSNIFQFDYAAFFELNYLSETLIHKKTISNILTEEYTSRYEKLIIPFDEAHPIVHFLKAEDSPFTQFEQKTINESTQNNQILFTIDEVKKLYIPVIARRKSFLGTKEIADRVLGVFEVGFALDSTSVVSLNQSACLKLYSDNMAQVYNKAYHSVETINIKTFVKDAERVSKSHSSFLNNILYMLEEIISADNFLTAFLSLDNTIEWVFPNKRLARSFNLSMISKDEMPYYQSDEIDINSLVKVIEDGKMVNVNNLSLKQKISGHDTLIKSQLGFPVRYDDVLVGFICFFSKRDHFFNDIRIKYIQNFLTESTDLFFKFKLSTIVQELVKPFAIHKKNEIYEDSCKRLSNYFFCSHVVFYENDINKKELFRPRYLSPALRKEHPDIQKRTITDLSIFIDKDPVIVNESDEQITKDLVLHSFATDNGFLSTIIIPCKTYKGTSRFIVLFSKTKVMKLFAEDKTLFNHLTSKINLSLAFADIFYLFKRSSEIDYDKTLDEILSPILESMQKLSGADLLILSSYDEELKKVGKISRPKGVLLNPDVENKLLNSKTESRDLAHIIMEEGDVYIQDEKQFKDKFDKISRGWIAPDHSTDEFYYRQNLKSFAAYRIEYGGERLGVLFFNFRTRQEFDDDTKLLFTLFNNLIGRILAFYQTLQLKSALQKEVTRATYSLAENEIATNVLHNIKNVFAVMGFPYSKLKEQLEKLKVEQVIKDSMSKQLLSLGEGIKRVQGDYMLFRRFIKTEKAEFEKSDLNFLIQDAISVIRPRLENDNIDLKLDKSESHPVVCDRLQIVHVFINLFNNSIDAGAKQIWVNCDKVIEREKNGIEKKYLVARVADNGSGIKKEIWSKIFDLNFTSKKDGTGRGLPMSKLIIEKHKGRIDFESTPYKYTAFSIFLPIN